MKRFLIIGEQCTDVFIYGSCSRLSPEAPVPVFNPYKRVENPGMAANVEKNLQNMVFSGTTNWEIESILSDDFSKKIRYVDQKTNHYFLRVDEEGECPRIIFGAGEKNKIAKPNSLPPNDS